MEIKSVSTFVDEGIALDFFEKWTAQVKQLSGTDYERIDVETVLGNTVVWGINTEKTDRSTIVIFPGFRTCSLFWDLDNALEPLKKRYRIFLVDVNGQPCLSDGKTPEIRSIDYGIWAAQLLEKLSIRKAIIAGASFGGLISLKLALVAPYLVDKVILLNPGCLQSFSLSLRNLYYNFLPLLLPREENVEKFLDNAVFYKNKHTVSDKAKKLIIDYELFAITQFYDRAQKPYPMDKDELESIRPDVYLVLGEKDMLFPYKKSLAIARKHLHTLREIYVVPETGHGIETSKKAMTIVASVADH